METQTDTLKVFKHHQHARVQKEGDDMWISSEDLRTEGSSDEETQGDARGRRSKKNRKQSKSALLDSSKSTSSISPMSSYSKQAPIKEIGDCTSEVEKATVEANIDMTTERFSILANPFAADVFPESLAASSAISLGSSDSGMDALNLESRWRPKRGSLKYPILVEDQTTVNYMNEVDGFFNEMMLKIKTLRNCSALDKLGIGEEVLLFKNLTEETQSFNNLKNTPAVQEKLKIIQKLDEQIKETMKEYEAEKAERLQVQEEMCQEICRSNPERETERFLELCQFEDNDSNNEEESVCKEGNNEARSNQKNLKPNNFIKRNIELARQGFMAGCSLTDEEKKKLEELLAEDHDDIYKDEQPRKRPGFCLEESDDSSDDGDYFLSNAYSLNDEDTSRVDDINSELEKFTLDETEKEKMDRRESAKTEQTAWRDAMLMEQRLKAINAKLDELQETYEREQAKLQKTSCGDGDKDDRQSESSFQDETANEGKDSQGTEVCPMKNKEV